MTFNQGRALIIGVASYKEVTPLPAAVLNDANDTATTLRSPSCGYPQDNVVVLTDAQATLEGIRKALAELASAAIDDDTVAIFFSGHGARFVMGGEETSGLVVYDSKHADLAGTTLREVELSAAIAAVKASRVIVVIDACHAGGVASLKSDVGNGITEGFDEKSLQNLVSGKGRVVFASSRASETSLIFNGERNSVFTTAMLAGLKGAAQKSAKGTINVFDLFNYVSEAVKNAAPGRQHPIFKASDMEENFPVSLALSDSKTPAPGADSNSQRGLEQIFVDLFPTGPMENDIWLRAGGDLARLRLNGNGRSQWYQALRLLGQGGGGTAISRETLIRSALEEFPHHGELQALL